MNGTPCLISVCLGSRLNWTISGLLGKIRFFFWTKKLNVYISPLKVFRARRENLHKLHCHFSR